jgi:monoamine oxidase
MTAEIFSGVANGQPSLREAYEVWAEAQSPSGKVDPNAYPTIDPTKQKLTVGIVGGGIAGLYAALLLQSKGAKVHIFEANLSRIGGRVYTYRFNKDPNQYFEAGAMRLPQIPEQKPVFDLIDYLNKVVGGQYRIETIPYVLYDDDGDLVYVNGRRGPDGEPMTVNYANQNPDELGFSKEVTGGKTAAELLEGVIGKFLKKLEENFDEGFAEIVKYDDYSFRSYLALFEKWPEERINYVEVMTSQTNQFQHSFTELVIENMDFSQAKWKSIKNGMDYLPNAMAQAIGIENITLGAKVTVVSVLEDGRVSISWKDCTRPETFDKVLMALPPAALHMIETPQWRPFKTYAIRSLHVEPLYKIGLRFKTRFWEKVRRPANGGQSITDLPSRWFVYPSYGIGDDEPGVLLLYAWMTDAVGWLPQDESERVRLALRDLQTVYQSSVDIDQEFIEAFEVNWSVEESTGDAMFFPGQFRKLFNVARQPEGHIYFAGEHLSVHHTWIVGAIDSAILACKQMLGVNTLTLLGTSESELSRQIYDYTNCTKALTLHQKAALE